MDGETGFANVIQPCWMFFKGHEDPSKNHLFIKFNLFVNFPKGINLPT